MPAIYHRAERDKEREKLQRAFVDIVKGGMQGRWSAVVIPKHLGSQMATQSLQRRAHFVGIFALLWQVIMPLIIIGCKFFVIFYFDFILTLLFIQLISASSQSRFDGFSSVFIVWKIFSFNLLKYYCF